MSDTSHIESIQIEHKPGSVDKKSEAQGKFPFDAFDFESPDQTNPLINVKAPWYFGARNGFHSEQASNAYTRMPVIMGRVGGNSTGAIKITIPGSRAMLEMLVMIHQYDTARNSDKVCQLLISGYMYTGTPAWNSPGCVMTGKMHNTTEMVRWARGPSGEWCILLGETGTVWNYPFVEVIWCHADYSSVDCMRSDWSMTFGITDTTGYTMDHTREKLLRSTHTVGFDDVSGNTTLEDDDGITVLHVTTGSSAITITLPTVADNTGRTLLIRKVDTGTGSVIVDGEGSETIDGRTTRTLYYENDYFEIMAGTSGWRTFSESRPVGEIIAMARYTTGTPAPAPDGFLLCDGSEVSRTTYARLYAALGTAWGDGDASTTFNLPTCDGVFLRGRDSGTTFDPDSASRVSVPGLNGATARNVGSYQDHAVEEHTHGIIRASGITASDQRVVYANNTYDTVQSNGVSSANTSAYETRPDNVYVDYYVRY